MSAELPYGGAGASESPEERTNRNFMELLQGFRVAVTGVQVLFVFLLTVPFAPGFTRVAAAERRVYFVSLAAAAVASLFYIAPVGRSGHLAVVRRTGHQPRCRRTGPRMNAPRGSVDQAVAACCSRS